MFNAIREFFVALVLPSFPRLGWSAGAAGACIALLFVPIANIPFILAAWPIWTWSPRFARSGPDVEWYFFGPLLKSPLAFVVVFAYFALIAYLLLVPLGYAALHQRQDQAAGVLPPSSELTQSRKGAKS